MPTLPLAREDGKGLVRSRRGAQDVRERSAVPARVFTYAPVPVRLSAPGLDFQRADIVFEGVEQGGPSFEARVFLNNPSADEATPKTPDAGYAGAFHVYGYGRLPPAEEPAHESAGEAATPVEAPMTRYVTATEAVRDVLRRGHEVAVTLVAVPYGSLEAPLDVDIEHLGVSIVLDPDPTQPGRPAPG
jgi:hypothetical protein